MPLSLGDKLGPYEILAHIGAGGMGEVWKARDTRLDRIVAIKVSNKQFGERFEREARAVAALNHPHICQLYDVGPDYLVMEFVEGAPLKGPMPVEKAVEYAGQILDALDAAHSKGIIHRDLKPDNILATKQGIKLLDFGLAKQQLAALKESDATLTHAMTRQGEILGTLQYMSPEQLQGKDADLRSDLFSFGCVLFEMLTGKRAFEGKSTASVIAAILEREPAPLTIAPQLERIVRRSLAKDPDQRFQTARDLKSALLWAMEQPAPGVAIRPGRRWQWIAAATLVIGAGLGWTGSRLLRPSATGPIRLAINPPGASAFSGPDTASAPAPQFAVSPDGRAIVFIASLPGGQPMLWIRNMDDTTARPLPGTENPATPFWSPDGRWVAFFSEEKLKKIPVGGGAVQVLATVVTSRGGSWGPNDTILFSSGNSGIFRVPASGGPLTPVIRPDLPRQEGALRFPQFLPDGRHFLYLARNAVPEYRGIYAGSLDGKTKKLLRRIDSNAYYSPSGYLFYTDADMLLAQPFDTNRLDLTGQPITVAERVGHGNQGDGAFSVSTSGVFAYAGPIVHQARLIWFDREGKNLGSVAPEGDYTDFRLSPDQKQLAASLIDPRSGNIDIWLTDIARGITSRFTFGSTVNASVAWSPDGKWIVYRTVRKGVAELYRKSASGGGREDPVLNEEIQRVILMDASNTMPTDWSPDGRHVLFFTIMNTGQLWLLPLSSGGGDAKPSRFVDSSADQMHGNFSPDGRLVAYTSNESGRFEVHVQTFPLSDRKWQVSTAGGYEPRWSGDGREIYYLSEDRKLIAVSVGPGPSFGVPKALFQTHVMPGVNSRRTNYVPSRDGQRFLVNTQTGDPPLNPITVVLNWTAGLKK
jgi:eukaryotic-like serine/threonine-protein kinase